MAAEAAGTVEKAVELLFHLHRQPAASGVTAIGRALGMPKSSAHRLLAALRSRGLVERDASGRYRTGIGLVALGVGALEREPLVVAARPVLQAGALAIGETFFLVAARAGRLVVLEKAEGTGFLRAAPQIGSELPVHATAVGRLYLAFAPDQIALPPPPFERFTPRTPVSARELERETAVARARGFAENREEWLPGLGVVAAPVPAARGSGLAGAVAVACTAARLAELRPTTVAERALGAARQIAERLAGGA